MMGMVLPFVMPAQAGIHLFSARCAREEDELPFASLTPSKGSAHADASVSLSLYQIFRYKNAPLSRAVRRSI
jgi:hypothetical protein